MKRVLNIGCGPKSNRNAGNPVEAFPDEWEFVRLDANPDNEPDIVHNMLEPLPDELVGAFDAVFSSHMLEHVGWREFFPTLRHIASAAKDDGLLYIIVPDLTWACRQIINGNYDWGVLGVFYGGQYNEFDFHKNGFTAGTIRTALRRIGWTVTKQTTARYEIDIDGSRTHAYQIETLAVRSKNAVNAGSHSP